MVTPRTQRFVDGLFGISALRLALWGLLVLEVLPGLFTDAHRLLAFMDDHHFNAWEQADRLSILRYGQLPLWNPFYCGGMVASAVPESTAFSPDFLLRLVVGVAHGRRLAVVLFLVLGMEGTYRLVRETDGSAVAGFFAAVVFSTFAKLVSTYLVQGWVNFFGFELLPWVFLGLLKGRKSLGWALAGGFALAWMVLAAGTYTTPYTAIAATLVTLCMCLRAFFPWDKQELLASIRSAATVAGSAVVFALVKIVPMLGVLLATPRVFTPVEQNDLFQLLGGYWNLYAIVLALAVVALFFRDFWARVFFVAAVLFLFLARGNFGEWSPFALLKKVPILSGLRLPDRFMVMFHFFAVLGAARGITHLEDGLATQGARVWTRLRAWGSVDVEKTLMPVLWSAVAAVTVIVLGHSTMQSLLSSLTVKPHSLFVLEPPLPVEQPFKQHRGNRRDAHVFPAMNRGTLYCFLEIPIPESGRLRADLAEEEYPENDAVAKVERLSWSPHEIKLKVDASSNTRVFVNQNYNAHWTSDVGHVTSVDKMLALEVPAGSHVVTLRYRHWGAYVCLFISLAAVATFLVYLGRRLLEVVRDRARLWRGWRVPF